MPTAGPRRAASIFCRAAGSGLHSTWRSGGSSRGAAINDAPLDQIQADPDEFSAARLLAFDSAMAARAQEVYRLLARRREDGAWAGHTVSNRHMIAVNDAIGCQVVNHGIVWQTYTERR